MPGQVPRTGGYRAPSGAPRARKPEVQSLEARGRNCPGAKVSDRCSAARSTPRPAYLEGMTTHVHDASSAWWRVELGRIVSGGPHLAAVGEVQGGRVLEGDQVPAHHV